MISDIHNSFKLFISLLIIYSSGKVNANDCDDGWNQYRNKCYNIQFQVMKYSESVDRCRRMEAQLVSIHSESEFKFLTEFMPENTFWMGANRNQSDRHSFVWTDHSDWDYENWAYTHPHNDGECVCAEDNIFITCDCESVAFPICQKWTKMQKVSTLIESMENRVTNHMRQIEKNIENRLKSFSEEFEIRFNTLYNLMNEILNDDSTQTVDKSINEICASRENCDHKKSVANSGEKNKEDNTVPPMAEKIRLLPLLKEEKSNISNSEINNTSLLHSNSNSSDQSLQHFDSNSTSSDDQEFTLNQLFTNFPVLNDSSVSEESQTETITLSDAIESMESGYDLNLNNIYEISTITIEVDIGSEYSAFVDSDGDLHQESQQKFEENCSGSETNAPEIEITTETSTLSLSSSSTGAEIETLFSNDNLTLDVDIEKNESNGSIENLSIEDKGYISNSSEIKSSFTELKLGEFHTQKVPSFSDWNLKLSQKEPNLVTFNYKLPVGMTAGVYGGKNRVPSHTKYDFMRVIGSTSITSRRPRSNRESNEKQNVEFTQYLDSGSWYITVYNDESQPQEISFVTIVTNNSQIECPNECSGHGVCVNGICECENEYFGDKCEYRMCPILCSNHGKYVKGQCLCDTGWKGMECEIKEKQCEDCNGNGECVDGVCQCFDGYEGKQCEKEEQCFRNCSGNGVCVKGECNCFSGYEGKDCETRIESCRFDCGKNGRCENGKCVCSQGWTGIKCDEHSCDPRCLDHGLCRNGTCICSQGWNGKYCTLDGCPRNCSNRGGCQQIDDEWSCDCFDGWAGNGCIVPLEVQCNDGFDNDYDGLIDCADSECCESKYCRNNPLCFSALDPTDVLMRKQPPSATSSFFKKMQFLIEDNSVQKYAAWESFVEKRASVIRGQVQNQYGYGLRGVRVGVDNEPSLGFTVTRNQGWFDILVNGGGAVTLHFLREPFQPLHVTLRVPWNEFVIIEKVTMHVDRQRLMQQTPEMCVEHNYETMRPLVLNDWKLKLENICNKRNESQPYLRPPALLETIPISKTNIALVYHSSRSSGFLSTLDLQLTPAEVPSTLKRVHLKIAVKGNLLQKVFESSANIKFTFVWNRLNIYKQKVYGIVTAKVHVGYEYTDCPEIIWEVREVKMRGFDINISDIGGWNLNIHHKLNTNNWIVHKGDGSNIYLHNRPKKVKVTMGFGEQRPIYCPHCNGVAEYQTLLAPIALASGPDGSLYVGDFNLVRRITKDGQVSTVIELTSAQLAYKYYLTISPFDGKLYISDPEKYQVLRAVTLTEPVPNPRTNLEVVIGSGIKCLPGNKNRCGDGRQARDARLAFPKGIAITLNNEMFIADATNIRMVDSNGIIHTLIGDHYHKPPWKPFPCVASIPIYEVNLRWPTELAINPVDNSLHILDDNLILRLTPDKRIRIVAGKQAHCSVSNVTKSQLATATFLETPQSIAFATNGDLFIAESDSHTINRVLKVNMDGEITRSAGVDLNCSCMQINCECFDEEDSIALNAKFGTISSIAVTEDGLLHICDQGNLRVRTVLPNSPYLNEKQEFEVIDNNETFLFNRYGLHIATKNAANGQIRYQFEYTDKTSAGKLSSITDARRNKIYLLRDHRKQPISIESAIFGHCKLTFTKLKHLKSFEAPHMNEVRMTYYEKNGLLKTRSDSNENINIYNYDENGRFLNAITPKGEEVRLNVSSIYDKLCEEIDYESNASISNVHS